MARKNDNSVKILYGTDLKGIKANKRHAVVIVNFIEAKRAGGSTKAFPAKAYNKI